MLMCSVCKLPIKVEETRNVSEVTTKITVVRYRTCGCIKRQKTTEVIDIPDSN